MSGGRGASETVPGAQTSSLCQRFVVAAAVGANDVGGVSTLNRTRVQHTQDQQHLRSQDRTDGPTRSVFLFVTLFFL